MVLSMNRWKGKVAIVTGASSGCGAAIAEQLVEHGLIVVGLARRKEMIEDLAEKLKDKSGKLYAIKADISKEDEVIKAIKWTKENVGLVHILINNAGISVPAKLTQGTYSDWKRIFETNVLGLCLATKEAFNIMEENDIAGHIIHISSVLGHYVAHVPNLNVYPATKFAITALTETLRQEVLRENGKIKVTSVSPGPVDTEFGGGDKASENPEYTKFFNTIPKLYGEDVADAVVYVLSTPPHVQVQDLMIRPLNEPV